MKISAIETLLLGGFPNMCWVRVETDAGISGWGETKNGARAVSDHIHDGLAPTLLGDDPMAIDRISRFMLYPYCGYKSTGAEIRAASAVDLALWDIRGKALNVPVYELLGGKTRERVRTYNTCAGPRLVSKGPIRGQELERQRARRWTRFRGPGCLPPSRRRIGGKPP